MIASYRVKFAFVDELAEMIEHAAVQGGGAPVLDRAAWLTCDDVRWSPAAPRPGCTAACSTCPSAAGRGFQKTVRTYDTLCMQRFTTGTVKELRR